MDNFKHLSRRMLPRISGFALFVLLLGMVATPARASQDVVQFGNTIEVAKDATIHDAVCFFCSVNVQGTIKGDTVVFFGNVRIDGQADGDVVNFFGDVSAADDASIRKGLVNFFGRVRLGENAKVGQDAVVMFGSLSAASTATIGGNQVVQPGWIFWLPLLLIIGGITFLVGEVRAARRRRFMRGY